MTVSFIGSSGVSGAAINGGSVTVTFATAPSAGDLLFALVVQGSSKATGGTAYSSNGTSYTALSSRTISTSVLATGQLWYRIAVAGETTMTASGTGGSSDATAVAAYVFRNQATRADALRYALTTGSGTTPDSPALTAQYNGDAVISAVYSAGNTAAAVTAPTSDGVTAVTFLNAISTGGSDTRLCQLGMSWFASTGSSVSYNPNAWAAFASTTWVAFTVVVESTDPYTPFDLVSALPPPAHQIEPGLSAAWTQYHSGITVPAAAVTVTWHPMTYWPDYHNYTVGMIGY